LAVVNGRMKASSFCAEQNVIDPHGETSKMKRQLNYENGLEKDSRVGEGS
jgi:hypothetical protein